MTTDPQLFTIIRTARNIWSWIRQVSGDAAYDNYLRSCNRSSGRSAAGAGVAPSATRACPANLAVSQAAAPLSRTEFYLHALRRRYSTVSRCC
jgi:hypothetical protein